MAADPDGPAALAWNAAASAAAPDTHWWALAVEDQTSAPACATLTHTILTAWRKQGRLGTVLPVPCVGPADVFHALHTLCDRLAALCPACPVLVVDVNNVAVTTLAWDAWVTRWLLARKPLWCTARKGRPVWAMLAGTAAALAAACRQAEQGGSMTKAGYVVNMQEALDAWERAHRLDADDVAGDMVWVEGEDHWRQPQGPIFVGHLHPARATRFPNALLQQMRKAPSLGARVAARLFPTHTPWLWHLDALQGLVCATAIALLAICLSAACRAPQTGKSPPTSRLRPPP
jgi:hypothetical protein